jgi:CRP-like cAMP-binding protein
MPLATKQALASIPLFSGLTDEQIAPLAEHLRRRTFQERETIVRRGDPGDSLYIITGGKVKVSYADEDDETIIAMLSAGDFFGELSLLDGEARSADVVALEPTETLVLSAADVRRSIIETPEVALSLLTELSGRLRRSTEWIRALSSQDVYGRIAQQLLNLSETHGVDAPGGGRRILIRLTQNDLAGIVGASRESVNKAIGFFKEKGHISVDTTYHITVHDRAALEKRCQQ